MKELLDVTHTVKASTAPSAGARYMFDPATGERYWVTDDPVEPEPEGEEVPPPPPEVPPEPEVPEVKPNPEVPPVPMPTLPKSKKAQ